MIDFSLTSANKPKSSLVLYLQFEVNRDRRYIIRITGDLT